MTDLVSVLRSLPEALEVSRQGTKGIRAWTAQGVVWEAAELLAGLFAVCPNCDGSGVDDPTPNFSESHPLPVPCPSCRGGVVIQPDIIERAAKVVCREDLHPLNPLPEGFAFPCVEHYVVTRAALWAVFGDT